MRRIALVTLTIAVPVVIVALAIAFDEDGDGDRPLGGRPALDPRDPSQPVPEPERCPPPGPAAVDPASGKTLCGAEARRFIRRYQRQAKERTWRMYGLTGAKERRARRVIAADPTLRRLLRGTHFSIAQVGPWTAGAPATKLTGVAATIRIRGGVSGTAVLPYVCKGDPAAGRGRLRERLRDVPELHVLAQLDPDRIAQIDAYDPSGRTDAKILEVLPGSTRCPRTRD
jgi:hypothetical protein